MSRDRPIGVGDLVVIVRPTYCCGYAGKLGYIGNVTRAGLAPGLRGVICINCCTATGRDADVLEIDHEGYVDRSRLKRIDPDCLQDDIPHAEPLAA